MRLFLSPFHLKTEKRHSKHSVRDRGRVEFKSQPPEPADRSLISNVHVIHKMREKLEHLCDILFVEPQECDCISFNLVRPQKPGRACAAQNIRRAHPEHADRLIVDQACPSRSRCVERITKCGIRPPSSLGGDFINVGLPHVFCEPEDVVGMRGDDYSSHSKPLSADGADDADEKFRIPILTCSWTPKFASSQKIGRRT